jgi:hypothetical protein
MMSGIANDSIIRIGRKPTPAENTFRRMLESPELLHEMTRNFFYHLRGVSLETRRAWRRMNSATRDEWYEKTIEHMRKFVAVTGSCHAPDDPGPERREGVAPRLMVAR